MNRLASQPYARWALGALLGLSLVMTGGCSSKAKQARYATVGSNCYAKAVPQSGEGGLAWGNTMSIARQKSLNNCNATPAARVARQTPARWCWPSARTDLKQWASVWGRHRLRRCSGEPAPTGTSPSLAAAIIVVPNYLLIV